MSKAILAAIVSLVLGVLAEASVGVRWNMTGIGCIVSVAIMGAFIIYFNDKKQRWTRGYKRYKETSGLIEWKECQIFHSIFT